MRQLFMMGLLCCLGGNAYAEYYPPEKDGMVTKTSILDAYSRAETYLHEEALKIKNKKERDRYVNSSQGWLNYLSSYVALVQIGSTSELNKLYPEKQDWVVNIGNHTFYYYVLKTQSQLQALVFQEKDDGISFVSAFYADTSVNYNFAPKVYTRKLNGENVQLIHFHGVMIGNGMLDVEELFVIHNNGELSRVDVTKVQEQLNAYLKRDCYINRGHSFLSESNFTFSGGIRCLERTNFISAHYDLQYTSDKEVKYSLAIIPSSVQTKSKSRATNYRGVARYKKGDYVSAIKLFNKAISQYPTVYEELFFDGYANLGLALLKEGKVKESIQASQVVCQSTNSKAKPLKGNAAYNIGKAYDLMGQKKKAVEYFIQAYRIQSMPAREEMLIKHGVDVQSIWFGELRKMCK